VTHYLIRYYVLFYCLLVLCTYTAQCTYIELDVSLVYVMLIVNKL